MLTVKKFFETVFFFPERSKKGAKKANKDLELVSSLARVHNSGSLFQSNVCNLFSAGN